MTFRQQIFDAITNSTVEKLQHLLENNTFDNALDAALGLRKACEANNIECVNILLPYATEYFNQPDIPADPARGKSMSLTPCDVLYQLMYDTVVPSNNIQMFGLFTDLLTSEKHMRQCPVILVQCFDLEHVDLIDCLLPLVENLSAVAQYKPQAYAFFEERKALYQNQRLSHAVGETSVFSIGRKI